MKNLKSILASSLLAASAAVSVLSFGASASTYSSEPRDQLGLAPINNSSVMLHKEVSLNQDK